MSEIMKAKQRLLLRSNSILQAEEEEQEKNQFVRTNKHEFTKKQPSLIRQKTQNQFKRVSPEFIKTDRKHYNGLEADKNERMEILSEQNREMPIFKQPRSGRRGTVYERIDPSSPNVIDMSFTERQRSIYNESPTKVVKMTVHSDKLSLIISKNPNRLALSPVKPKQCQKQKVKQLIENEKEKGIFTDVMFPPKATIMFNRKTMYQEEGMKFERLVKIYEKNQIYLVKFSEPTFLIPGKFTSSALYCALAILCEDPSKIISIFQNQQLNENGIYYLNLCKDGVWRHIIIDDNLPVKSLLKRTLLFLHTIPKNNVYEVWPCLIEKAIAKIYGTYQDILLTQKKGIRDVMRCLTGYPVSEYSISKDFRAYLVIIDAALKKKQIVVLQNIFEDYRQTAYLKNLDYSYSYQIVEVKKNYIGIRNLGEKDLVTKLSFEEAMIFTKLLIFRHENNFSYISKTMRHKKGYYSQLSIEIENDTKCYWDIWQNNEVYYKKHIGSMVEYRLSPFYIRVERIEQNSEVELQTITESGKIIEMKSGKYRIRTHLCQMKEQDFTLSFYGQNEIRMERVRNRQKWERECFC